MSTDKTNRGKTVSAWVYDADNANLNARFAHRTHREGHCVSDEPWGVKVGPVRSYEGNPNDFHCGHCQMRFRRVVVNAEVALYLRSVPLAKFDGTNGLTGVEDFPVSRQVWGCDCRSGHEHSHRGPHPTGSEGQDLPGECVPIVFNKWVVELTSEDLQATVEGAKDAASGTSATGLPIHVASERAASQVHLPSLPQFIEPGWNPHRNSVDLDEDELLDLKPSLPPTVRGGESNG